MRRWFTAKSIKKSFFFQVVFFIKIGGSVVEQKRGGVRLKGVALKYFVPIMFGWTGTFD
jgi:hypothetical protein